ncbi:MAG: class I SAM-dependent methyltransferase [Methanomassiliicoccales archaeon]|nr:class I SAM-dependent methyltransferase [Methanomassiliicoccales archaeon]NYT16108.1 class I SAM-dependent methyltransferase [Methanomassiliicoccales archaeon]
MRVPLLIEDTMVETDPIFRQQRRNWDGEYKRKGVMWRGITKFEISLPNGSRVLEIGCGNGKTIASLKGDDLPIVAIDFSFKAIELCRFAVKEKKVSLMVADARFLPFHDDYFDVVISSHLLEHLSESGRNEAVAEMERVLRPGGRTIVSALSTRDMRFGRGKEIERNTFLRGGSISTHYFTPGEMRELFEHFIELDLHEEVEETLYSGEPVRRANIDGIFILDRS